MIGPWFNEKCNKNHTVLNESYFNIFSLQKRSLLLFYDRQKCNNLKLIIHGRSILKYILLPTKQIWSYSTTVHTFKYINIYIFLNQCLSPLKLLVRTRSLRGVLDTTLCDKVFQWLATSRWFSLGTPVSSTNKTDTHDITAILLEVALNTIKQPNHISSNRKLYHTTIPLDTDGCIAVLKIYNIIYAIPTLPLDPHPEKKISKNKNKQTNKNHVIINGLYHWYYLSIT